MSAPKAGEILSGLWRFEAVHPEWTEEEGGEDGWERDVAWWIVRTSAGAVLVDPLVEDWVALDVIVESAGGCAGIVRTCHWHERTIPEAARRYSAPVWARRPPAGNTYGPFDHVVTGGDEIFDGWRVIDVERTDELGLYIPDLAALMFGDVMLRRESGELRVCPPSWTQPPAGHGRLLEILDGLTELAPEHVLVSHGPLVLGDGLNALRAALRA